MLRAWMFRAATVASALGAVTLSLDAGDRFSLRRPKSGLIEVARSLDQMERDLNQEGTIVIKSPDIWGESRLTKHRQEFERQLASKVDGFELLLNASIRRSDQAYFANALAIQAALQGPSGGAADPTQPPTQANMSLVNSLTTGTLAGTTAPPSEPLQRTGVFQLVGQDTARFTGFAGMEGSVNTPAVGLEPTIQLDQLKRYLDHLHEIRRVNEGDDTSDSPGYSLNLVRVPVSILPGDETKEGYGAEITVTCKPHVTQELLARVFRELVINDLVDALSVPILKIAEDGIDPLFYTQHDCGKSRSSNREWLNKSEFQRVNDLVTTSGIPGALRSANSTSSLVPDGGARLPQAPPSDEHAAILHLQNLPQLQHVRVQEAAADEESMRVLNRAVEAATQQAAPVFSPGLARNARQPVAPSQLNNVFGRTELVILAYEFWKRRPNNGEASLTDSRAFLKEQLQAGYDYLNSQIRGQSWSDVNYIYEAIRADDVKAFDGHRKAVSFSSKYWATNGKTLEQVEVAPSPVAACAWWILVESALLNEHLNEDMQRVSHDPNCGCLWAGPHVFYGPHPGPDAQQAFIEYVNCRWPIHVFALDPVVQQQNIADQFSMRREMQLALALAFSSGEIGAQSMTRYARRLELDMETIALNQTQVAFGHGADTFGWRFTPRVQTPPFESTHRVLFNELIMGGPNRDQLRKRWELEPGQRECVAIVLMPSFIEHVTFHARGNYFRMKSPDKRTGALERTVDWSARLRNTQFQLTQCYGESERYLPGEVDRMRERVEQLAKQLPLQTVHARVPNENTLGGFEMFSSGITDLGPELLDFYGHPGVDINRDTTMFLVGNHFSVHDTHVIAGNRECQFELVSRQVMKVTIPAGVQPVKKPVDRDTGCNGMIVDVHIATPYGVSAHLDIPVINEPSDVNTSLMWARREIPVLYRFKRTQPPAPASATYDIANVNILVGEPQEIAIDLPPYGTPASTTIEFTMTTEANQASILLEPTGGAISLTGVNDKARKQIVLSGATYGDFHRKLRDAVKLFLDQHYGAGNPPALIDVKVRGRVPGAQPTNIVDDFHVLIRLESI